MTVFDYAGKPEYEGNDYERRRDELLEEADQRAFSYEPGRDPVWQSYLKQYRREGQLAAEDALGRAAAKTGGVPSSYAVTAAAQAENRYAAQLADRLPELAQNAYSRYLAEYQRLLGLAESYNSYGRQDYERYLDALAQYNTDRSFDYKSFVDRLSREAADEESFNRQWRDERERLLDREYRQDRDALESRRYDSTWSRALGAHDRRV